MSANLNKDLYVINEKKYTFEDEFLNIKTLVSTNTKKINFHREYFVDEFGIEFTRNYCKQAILLLHLVAESNLFIADNKKLNTSIVAAVSEADFEFKGQVDKHNYRNSFGLRQFLTSTPAYLPHVISNYFGLNTSIITCSSTENRIYHSLQLAELETIEKKCVLIIAGNTSDINDSLGAEIVFTFLPTQPKCYGASWCKLKIRLTKSFLMMRLFMKKCGNLWRH